MSDAGPPMPGPPPGGRLPAAPPHTAPARQPGPGWKPALITLLAGLVLGVSSSVGFVCALNFQTDHDRLRDALIVGTAVLFCVSLLVLLAGLVMLATRVLRPLGSAPPPTTPAP